MKSSGSFVYIHFCLCLDVSKEKYKENIFFSCCFYHISINICNTELTKHTEHTKMMEIKGLEKVELTEKRVWKQQFSSSSPLPSTSPPSFPFLLFFILSPSLLSSSFFLLFLLFLFHIYI